MKIAIIGCGNLGLSIAHGLLDGIEGSQLTVTRRNTDALKHLEQQKVTVTDNNKDACLKADIILLAVKPYNVQHILQDLTDELRGKTLVSLATGVSLAELKALLPDASVFRAMPNTATDVKESITCVCGDGPKREDVLGLFRQIGDAIVIEEELMNSATILGACGIAYALRFIRAMIQGGIEIGFDAQTAGKIVNQTVKGAAQLLIQNNQHPEHEIDKVTTPKGCTIVGLNEMEHNGFSSSLIKGIVTSHNKIS